MQEAVLLAGGAPQHELASLLRRADLFVLPGVIAPCGQMEGIPVALMPEDPTPPANAIATLCRDPDLRRTMRGRERERVARLRSAGHAGANLPAGAGRS